MAIAIKKFSKKAAFSIVIIAGVFFAFVVRILFGAGHINLSRLNSAENNPVGNEASLVNTARADTPSSCSDPSSCGGDGSGDGSGDSG